MSECIMNETKIMVNGVLDKTAAIKYLTGKLASDAETIKVIFFHFLKKKLIQISTQ